MCRPQAMHSHIDILSLVRQHARQTGAPALRCTLAQQLPRIVWEEARWSMVAGAAPPCAACPACSWEVAQEIGLGDSRLLLRVADRALAQPLEGDARLPDLTTVDLDGSKCEGLWAKAPGVLPARRGASLRHPLRRRRLAPPARRGLRFGRRLSEKIEKLPPARFSSATTSRISFATWRIARALVLLTAIARSICARERRDSLVIPAASPP